MRIRASASWAASKSKVATSTTRISNKGNKRLVSARDRINDVVSSLATIHYAVRGDLSSAEQDSGQAPQIL
jgi:hypothetical protein